MRARLTLLAGPVALAAGVSGTIVTGQQAQPAPAAQAGAETRTPPTFFPPNYIGWELPVPPVEVPEGFTPIFNGTNLSGWDISRTNHHGRTPDFFVQHGMILATQNPFGGGGILLTDTAYGNFALYMEVKPDW